MILSDLGRIPSHTGNGILAVHAAMPNKEPTSDGTSSFSMGRRAFTSLTQAQSQKPNSPYLNVAQDINGKPRMYQDSATSQQKKWMNANRDASARIQNRRVRAIGTSINL